MREIEGNLLDMAVKGQFDIIAHGCNTYNVMGAGIAGQIHARFPRAYYADTKYFNLMVMQFPYNFHEMMLGTMSQAFYKRFSILNIYTQRNLGKDFKLEYLIDACIKINTCFQGKRLGLPLIGCGIGGGNPDDVLNVYRNYLRAIDLTVVHYKP